MYLKQRVAGLAVLTSVTKELRGDCTASVMTGKKFEGAYRCEKITGSILMYIYEGRTLIFMIEEQ
jgi:hypothetical protein